MCLFSLTMLAKDSWCCDAERHNDVSCCVVFPSTCGRSIRRRAVCCTGTRWVCHTLCHTFVILLKKVPHSTLLYHIFLFSLKPQKESADIQRLASPIRVRKLLKLEKSVTVKKAPKLIGVRDACKALLHWPSKLRTWCTPTPQSPWLLLHLPIKSPPCHR